MLEILNDVGCIAQPFGPHQEWEKHPPRGCQYEHETMWRPCLITISPTSITVVDRVLVNWEWPELTNNELKWQIMSILCKKKLMNEQGMFQALTIFSANLSNISSQNCLLRILAHKSLRGVQLSAWIFSSLAPSKWHHLRRSPKV